MSYLVLARKWRPRTFEDIVGEEYIVRILKNAISEKRIAHAYLFSGPRGVGKTSTARILAKALNCENGPTAAPCCDCGFCNAITEGASVDVIEIDGASNNSVDDIRTLRENVRYAPSGSRFKIYIIDEAHMLSQSAFNALLKTLEEPPSHVIFILATTAPHKIITTVLSRCQHLPFKRVSSSEIKNHLQRISDSEGLVITGKALDLISKAADGSVRDSLTLLEQVSSFTSEIDDNDVRDMLGISDASNIILTAEALISGDKKKIVEILSDLYESGTDLTLFIRDLIEMTRDLLVSKITGDKELFYEDISDRVNTLLSITNEEILTVILDELIKAETAMRTTYSPKISLDMSLIRICFLNNIRPLNDIIEEINGLITGDSRTGGKEIIERRPHFPDEKKERIPQSPPAQPLCRKEDLSSGGKALPLKEPEAPKVKEEAEVEAYYESPKQEHYNEGKDEGNIDPGNIVELWNETVKKISASNHILGCKLSEGRPEIKGNKIDVVFSGGNAVHAESVGKNKKKIESILSELAGKHLKISISSKKEQMKSLKELKKEAMARPIVKEALDLFEGKLVDVKLIK